MHSSSSLTPCFEFFLTSRAELPEADATETLKSKSRPMLLGNGQHNYSRLSFGSSFSSSLSFGNALNLSSFKPISRGAISARSTRAEYTPFAWKASLGSSASSGHDLSLGVELECVIADIKQVPKVRALPPWAGKEDILALVAEELTKRIRWFGKGSESKETRVSVEKEDWGHLWTVTEDTSVCTSGLDQFAVEAVSKRMRLDLADRLLFCDIANALSMPPFSAKFNDSTGIHVHIGCYPNFFTATEVACIIKAYLRLEPAINRLLLPPSRQSNRFCRDLAEVLSETQTSPRSTETQTPRITPTFGQKAVARAKGEVSEKKDLEAHIDSLISSITDIMKRCGAESPPGVRGVITKKGLLRSLQKGPLFLGQPMFWSTNARTQLQTPLKADGYRRVKVESFEIPRGMVLQTVTFHNEVLWQRPTSVDLWPPAGQRRRFTDLPVALTKCQDEVWVECFFCLPDDVNTSSMDLWLLKEGLISNSEEARYCKLNVTRIALPSEQATLEFRQFPSGYFDNPLFIWGWVCFLARLVDRACAVAAGVPGARLPADDSQEELETFLELQTDPTLMAWFRDACRLQQTS